MPEVSLGLEIPYTLEEFFAVRDELVHFSENRGFEPVYRDRFYSDEISLDIRSLWMVNSDSSDNNLYDYAVYLNYFINPGLIRVTFIRDGFMGDEELESTSHAFVEQFVTDRKKTSIDITQRYVLAEGYDKWGKIQEKE